MRAAFADLLAVAHRALSDAPPLLPESMRAQAGPLAGELTELLQARNGFYAFGAALHVFPAESTKLSWGMVDWNMPGLWKHEYASFVDPGVCFAEDIFGNQFCIRDGTVHFFTAETGKLEPMAASIEEWASALAADDGTWSGWPFAKRWAEQHGPMPLHSRLHPAIPFVCGGSYETDNLHPVDAAEMMAKWGWFARQIRDVPDGGIIKIVVDPEMQG
jgi:hypothetical protein